MRIIKLKNISGSGAVAPRLPLIDIVFISPFFAIFKNVVHSLETGETPSDSASHQAQNNAQRS